MGRESVRGGGVRGRGFWVDARVYILVDLVVGRDFGFFYL